MVNSHSVFEFARPRYWLTWIGLAALRSVATLPYFAQVIVGNSLGLLIRYLPLAYVRIARCNLALCLPNRTGVDREALLRAHCRSLGMGLCETANTWWHDDNKIRRRARIQGTEHLLAALAAGKGAIVIGGHFTTIEMATRILGTIVPLNVLYRPPKNRLLASFMRKSMGRHGNPIPYDDIRALLRALRRNEVVWYAPDQSYRNKGAAMVCFFGVAAATTTATSRIAAISGAPVLTYFPQRLQGMSGYRVVIGRAMSGFPSGNAIKDAERFNAALEEHILRAPEQYLWIHRRFKGLGSEYPDYYGRDSRQLVSASARTPI